MNRSGIDALMVAHGGRARAVATFHVLRQVSLEADDHAFLLEHAGELRPSELLRWRARCEPGFSGAVMRALARACAAEPDLFEHEVLAVPRLDLDADERRELAELLRGKVADALLERLLSREVARAPLAPRDATSPFAKLPVRAPEGSRAAATLDDSSLAGALLARRAGVGLDDAAFAEMLLARARGDDGDDWSRRVAELPLSAREAVLERCRRTPRDGERANLLGWLAARDQPRAELVPIALEPVLRGAPSPAVLSWLASTLVTRASWERHGEAVLSALLSADALAEMADLVTACFAAAGSNGASHGFVEALHGALAFALVQRARSALESERTGRAMAALSALVCLDPPPRLSPAIHGLRKLATTHARTGREALELVGVAERLVKHAGGREAAFEGVIAAIHLLSEMR